MERYSRLTFGKHKGQRLDKVPRDYLQWLVDERPRQLKPGQLKEVQLLLSLKQERDPILRRALEEKARKQILTPGPEFERTQTQILADMAPGEVHHVDPEGLEVHEVARLFPDMAWEDFETLKQSISQFGIQEPLWLYEGKIIDGASRHRAAVLLGLTTVPVKNWDGKGSLIDFVLARNLARRHLSQSQKAALAAEIEPWLATEAKERMAEGGQRGGAASAAKRRGEGENAKPVALMPPLSPPQSPVDAGRARDHAAAIVGVSPRYVSEAKRIKEQSPHDFERVKAGKQTITRAHEKIRTNQERARLKKHGLVADGPATEEQGTAYHEAGHAVMAYMLDVGLEEVSIRPEPGRRDYRRRIEKRASLGHCKHTATRREHRIMLTFAGPLAEQRFTGGSTPARGTDQDIIRGAAKLSALQDIGSGYTVDDAGKDTGCYPLRWSDPTRRAYLSWLRLFAQDILEVPTVWKAVMALATALLEKKHLTGDEATAVIAAKTQRLRSAQEQTQ